MCIESKVCIKPVLLPSVVVTACDLGASGDKHLTCVLEDAPLAGVSEDAPIAGVSEDAPLAGVSEDATLLAVVRARRPGPIYIKHLTHRNI